MLCHKNAQNTMCHLKLNTCFCNKHGSGKFHKQTEKSYEILFKIIITFMISVGEK